MSPSRLDPGHVTSGRLGGRGALGRRLAGAPPPAPCPREMRILIGLRPHAITLSQQMSSSGVEGEMCGCVSAPGEWRCSVKSHGGRRSASTTGLDLQHTRHGQGKAQFSARRHFY